MPLPTYFPIKLLCLYPVNLNENICLSWHGVRRSVGIEDYMQSVCDSNLTSLHINLIHLHYWNHVDVFLFSRSALAEAELEYKQDHKSKALLVKFPVTKIPDAMQNLIGKHLNPLWCGHNSFHFFKNFFLLVLCVCVFCLFSFIMSKNCVVHIMPLSGRHNEIA